MDASYKIQRGIHVHLIQFFMCPEFWVHISVYLRFFCAIFGDCTKRQAGQVWPHLLFLRPEGAAKTLVGEPPQTRHFRTRRRKLHIVHFRTNCPKAHSFRCSSSPHKTTVLRGPRFQSKLSASLSLPLLFLILAPVRHAQQIVNVGLERHGLPHFLLGCPVLGVQGLFLRCQLAALFF